MVLLYLIDRESHCRLGPGRFKTNHLRKMWWSPLTLGANTTINDNSRGETCFNNCCSAHPFG